MSGKDDDEKGPLTFLDRLLETERDSNLHLGDVRFWKHLEYIETAHIYRTSSLEYKTMKLMFCEAIFYLMFLGALTGLIVTQRSGSLYESRRQQLDYWAGCTKYSDGTRSCDIYDITNQEQLMTWMKEELAPKAFTAADMFESISEATSIFRLQSGVARWTPRFVGDTKTSVLVGAVRIRQLRVQYNLDCTIMDDLKSIHPDCFPKYSPGVESKMKWHPTWCPKHVQPHFKWYDANETEQGDTQGYHGVYPGSGFLLDLPNNISGAAVRMRELDDWSWLDERTRAVIIELNTLNPNVNIFVNVKLVFEFPATGGVYTKADVTSFRAIQTSLALAATDDVGGIFSLLIVTTALWIIFVFYVTYLFCKNGSRYFTYFWSSVDIVILVLYFIQVCTYLVIFGEADKQPSLHPEVLGDPEMFFPFGRLVPHLEFSNACLACLSLFAWLKVLKYFTLSGIFMGYVRVIERTIVNLLLFTSLLFLVLFGFAAALHLGYGKDDNLFATIWGSLVAVIVAPAGGVDLSPIFAPGDLLGPILIFMYIIVVFLLLLNVLMAICVDTYSVCMYELQMVNEERNAPNPTLVFLWTYFNAFQKVKLVGKESEEDRGGPHEQEIPLTSLPEAIQLQYLSEKQRMQNLLESAEAAIREEERKRMEPELYATTMSAEGDDDDVEPSPPTTNGFNPQPPEEDLSEMVVKRVQLQRMLEDSSVMVEICGTDRAVDVVRRFRVDLTGIDPYQAVAELQANVAARLKELESQGLDLTFDEMEALKTVSSELHSALTESQKEWRAELLSVLQMASLLSRALIDLTGQIAKVQLNHKELEKKSAPK
jgi:hypothetical protein